MRATRRAVTALAVLALVLAPSSPAAAADLITVDAGSAIQTLPAREEPIVTVPFTPADPKKDLESKVADVRANGKAANRSEREAVSVDVVDLALVATIDMDAWKDVGPYIVTVRVSAGQESQLVDLTLTRAAATVTAPPKLIIIKTVGTPELKVNLWDTTTKEPPFTIVAGDDSRIQGVSVAQALPEAGGKHDDVAIVFPGYGGRAPKELSGPLRSGGRLTLDYKVQGDLPLGTVTRSVEIKSPQLAAPVVVQAEITTARTTDLIWILLVAGFIIGWLVRHGLVTVKNKANAMRAQLDVTRRIRDLIERHRDPATLQVLEDQLRVAGEARGWKDSDYPTRLGEVEEAVNTELDALRARLRDRTTAANEISLAVELRPELPVEVRTSLDRARHLLDKARAAIEERNSAEAETHLVAARAQLKDVTWPNVKSWCDSIHPPLDSVVKASGSWPTWTFPVSSAARRALAALPVDAEPNSDATKVPGEIAPRLDRLVRSMREVNDLARAVELVADQVESSAAGSAPDVIAALGRARTASTAVQPKYRVEQTETRITELVAAVAAAQPAGAPAGALAGGPVGAPPDLDPVDRGPERVSTAVATAAPQVSRFQAVAASLMLGAFSFGVDLFIHAVLLALLVAVSMQWFEPGWIGDREDMLKVFMWAFTVDLSVEFVTTTLKTKPTGIE